jgi:hypothetical protein
MFIEIRCPPLIHDVDQGGKAKAEKGERRKEGKRKEKAKTKAKAEEKRRKVKAA